jgi:hypothetical protein
VRKALREKQNSRGRERCNRGGSCSAAF